MDSFGFNVIENGIPRTQQYLIPSRAQCLACHTPQAGHALSFNMRQMYRSETIHGHTGNQIDLLRLAGYFTNTPTSTTLLPRHLRPDETGFSLEARSRSYLAVNCASCHFAGGTAPGNFDMRPQLTFAQTGLLNGVAVQSGADPLNRLIVAGDTAHSIVLNRMAVTNGFTRMPSIGSAELDQGGITLITNWINQLATRQSYAQWRMLHFGNTTSPEGAPTFDADHDGQMNEQEFLTGTAPLLGGSLFTPQSGVQGSQAVFNFTLPPNRGYQIEISLDLLNWQLWDVPGNNGLPAASPHATFTAPLTDMQRFFRVLVREQ